MLLIRSGQLADAEESAAACFRLGIEVGDADAYAYYGAHLLAIRWLQGRGAEMVDLAAEVADSATLVQAEFTFRATVARLAADAGQLDRARAALDRLTGAGLAALPQSSTWLAGMMAIVEAAHALGEADVARQAYRLLVPFGQLPIMPSVAVVCFGSVQRSLGLAALTFGDLSLAARHLDQAVADNMRFGNRPMAACSRAELAGVLHRRGAGDDRGRARELLDRAPADAEAMGMSARAERWRREVPDGGDEVAIRRRRQHWEVAYGDRRVLVEDLVGVRYLARLVAQPDVHVAALDLAGDGTPPVVEPTRQSVIDGRARAAYERRARDVLAELAEAREGADLARAERLQAEADALADELGQATGLGGRARAFTGPAERARTAVRKAIARALDTIEAADACIAAELRARVTTGYHCRYTARPVG
jgi:hypothetical protein